MNRGDKTFKVEKGIQLNNIGKYAWKLKRQLKTSRYYNSKNLTYFVQLFEKPNK